GSVLGFGAARFLGAPPVDSLRSPLVGMAATPSGAGYWLTAADGGIFAYGDAPFLGSTGALALRSPIVGMTARPAPPAADQTRGPGYWLVAADGGVFAFGAPFHGSTGGLTLRQPVVGTAVTPSGNGYWLVARDGGVFSFGDASFLGSMGGTRLNQPVVGMAATPSGRGYWLVAADGGLFSFGDATFLGSMGGQPLNRPITAMASTPSGQGYWLTAADGGSFSFGDATFLGSGIGRLALGTQVAGLATHPAGGHWMVAGRPVPTLGAVGPGVENLQRRLLDLGFWGVVDGRYGPQTTQQVYAFQKANGLPRDGQLDGAELALLGTAQRVGPRAGAGRLVEVDKTRQLIIVSVDGYTEWVFNTSTGNGRPYGRGAIAITPEGRFRVSRQIDGLRISELGELFRPKYFVGGYAVHGSPSVPPFPASHGCVRVTNAAINFIWANGVIPLGTEVWVYS
ncbi:MAG: L,D-transpeptidase family protein, partial [Acidimicrobiales bacterium]